MAGAFLPSVAKTVLTPRSTPSPLPPAPACSAGHRRRLFIQPRLLQRGGGERGGPTSCAQPRATCAGAAVSLPPAPAEPRGGGGLWAEPGSRQENGAGGGGRALRDTAPVGESSSPAGRGDALPQGRGGAEARGGGGCAGQRRSPVPGGQAENGGPFPVPPLPPSGRL